MNIIFFFLLMITFCAGLACDNYKTTFVVHGSDRLCVYHCYCVLQCAGRLLQLCHVFHIAKQLFSAIFRE